MDSRIDPLAMLGLKAATEDLRNPGGRVTPQAMKALVLCAHLLNVDRILVIPHSRCAMASASVDELRTRIGRSAGVDASWQSFHVVADQMAALSEDVQKVKEPPADPRVGAGRRFHVRRRLRPHRPARRGKQWKGATAPFHSNL